MATVNGSFGRYQLLDVLGEGGFATVYRARDPALGRDVAVKALRPHLAADAAIRQRFIAEGQALAALHHANIVIVYDVGEAEGQPFFAMELIHGWTLAAEFMEGTSAPPARVAAVLRSLASAVDYLHAAGLVHRDIKPANVMTDAAGRVVLMDFGVARALDQTHRTQVGSSLGTPRYMAPEQVRGEATGPEADIYALGVLAFELVAGRPPFIGDTAHVLHAQAYEASPPLRALVPDLPVAVERAIGAALAKHPAQRPATALLLAQAFAGEEPWPRGAPSLGGAQGQRTPLLLAAITGGVATVVIVALFLLLGRSGRSAPLPAPATAAVVQSPAAPATSTPLDTIAAVPTPFVNAPTATPTPAAAASPAPTPGAPPALQVSQLELRNQEAWAAGQADLQACFGYQNALPGRSGVRVRVTLAGDRSSPIVPDAGPTALNAASGEQCAAAPARGAVAAGEYVALFFDEAWQARGEYAFTVRPPAPAPTVAARFQPGELVRANTPRDCLALRTRPSIAETNSPICLADGSHVRVLDGPVVDGGVRLWQVAPWSAGAGVGGWARDDYLVSSPDCDRNRTARWCDTAVATSTPTPRPATAVAPPVGLPTVAGDWTLTDYLSYGTGAGDHYTFAVHLDQQGTGVSGSSAQFSLSGQLDGRTLRATYRQGNASGEFVWTFTQDGTRFEGAFSNGALNGGTSYGRRASGSVSSVDQATIFLIGSGVSGDRVRANGEMYICFTVSRRSEVMLTSLVSGTVFYSSDDDGAGDCLGPYTDPPAAIGSDGRIRYRIDMRVNNTVVAQSTTSALVTR